jgi:hypothetical protein
MVVLGWTLVLVSGYGGEGSGNFGGVSELVWRVGGVTLYVSIPVLLTAGILGPLRSAVRRFGHRT